MGAVSLEEHRKAAENEGDLPGEGEEEQGQPELPPVEVEGTGQQLTLEVGGERPTKATVKLQGGSIGIPVGQFDKGEEIDLVIRARCMAVAVIDKRDGQTGQITETERRHTFKVTNVNRLQEED